MKAAAIARAKRHFPEGCHTPVQRHMGAVVRVECLCGAPLGGLTPVPGPIVPGRPVPHVFAYFPNYQEAEITFDDGTKHVTNGCRECLANARDDTAEKFYARDLLHFERLETMGEHHMMPAHMWELMGKRRVASMRLMKMPWGAA
jgi:hypothetical protein